MKKKIKRNLQRLMARYVKEDWSKDDRIKVLIQTSEVFTAETWMAMYEANVAEYAQRIEIKYVKERFRFLKLFDCADVVFDFYYNNESIKNCTKLKLFYLGARCYDHIGMEELPEDIKFCRIPPCAKEIIAEHVLMVTLAIIKKFPVALKDQFRKAWNQTPLLKAGKQTLTDKVIGIAGTGIVGITIAELFKKIGCNVIGCGRRNPINNDVFSSFFHMEELEEFLSAIDVLIIAVPLNRDTVSMFNKENLCKLGRTSYIINISRGKVLVEEDLVYLLENKLISGAALDVLDREPLPSNSKLWNMENIIITPHIAGNINFFVKEIQQDFFNVIKEELLT